MCCPGWGPSPFLPHLPVNFGHVSRTQCNQGGRARGAPLSRCPRPRTGALHRVPRRRRSCQHWPVSPPGKGTQVLPTAGLPGSPYGVVTPEVTWPAGSAAPPAPPGVTGLRLPRSHRDEARAGCWPDTRVRAWCGFAGRAGGTASPRSRPVHPRLRPSSAPSPACPPPPLDARPSPSLPSSPPPLLPSSPPRLHLRPLALGGAGR